MPHLLLAGAPTGCWTNLGDEAILAGMVRALRAAVADVRFTVITSSPPETYEPYGVESVRFDDLPGVAAAVAGSDAVLLGGGSIFFDYWKCDASAVLTARHQGVSLWTGLALLAAADGIPVVTYDVGVNPLRTADGLLMSRAVFDLAAVNTVRDRGSQTLATEWGVPADRVVVTGDPAIQVQLPATTEVSGTPAPGPVLGVALRQWDTGVDEKVWAQSIASAVDAHLERTGGRAVFVACHRAVRWPLTDDAAAATQVIELMRHRERASTVAAETPWQQRAALISGFDALLTMRYHAALFGLRAGVPTVGLSYDAKVANLFTDWGVGGRCLQLAEAAADPQRAAALLADPASGSDSGDAVVAMHAGADAMLAGERRAAELVADVLAATDDAQPPATQTVRELLARLAGNRDERPDTFNDALDRLAGRIGAPSGRRPTVAILTNRLLDRDTGTVQIGGAERYALAVARLLHDLGLAPAFYQGGGSFEVGDFYGFPVHPLPFGEAVSEFQVGIASEFHERTADADHVLYLMPNYGSGPMREDAVLISHGVWWDHDLWPHLDMRSPAWQKQLERVFTQPRRVISVDANTADVVRAMFPAATGRIRHIPSAVDTTVFTPPAPRTAQVPLVLFPRRAEAIRGAQLVGPVLDLVPDPCRVAWVGGGSKHQVAGLRAVAKRDRRLTVRDAAFEQMPQEYAAADICVIPSVGSEGQSLSCLEAMASECAVVVTRVGGLHELVTDGVDGLVCDPTPESLATAIRRLVRDPALRARLGAAGRRTALRHSEEGWRAAWTRELLDLGWVDHRAATQAVPYDVIKFSMINWEQRYQRPQQTAAHWGRRGRRVFYVRVDDHLPLGGPPFSVTPVADGVYDVRLALPPGARLHRGELPAGFVPAAVAALDALRANWNVERAVSVVELASWQPVAAAARDEFGWRVVYDCMDNWSTFPGFAKRPAFLGAERTLVRTADAMAVSSRNVQEHWAADRPTAALVRNAADFDFFHDAAGQDDPIPPEPIAAITGPVAGFVGAVVEWFDVEIVRRAALARPDVNFVFVGGIARVSVDVLDALPNVHFLGQQPYEDMPRYLRRFDVCLVPFLVNEVTASMDLVKVYEYFAQGKPVVCTPVAEMVPYGSFMYLADGPEQFIAQLDRALAEDDPDAVRRRIELARANSWDDRIEVLEQEILTALTDARPEPVEQAVRATGPTKKPAAPAELAAARAELRAAQAQLAKLNKTKGVQVLRRYWAARRTIDRAGRKARRVYRRVRPR